MTDIKTRTRIHTAGIASGGDTSACSTEVQLRATVEEVRQHLRRTLPETKIRAYVVRAYRDLQGSVNPEALPEMSGRLAAVRLHSDEFTVVHAPVTTAANQLGACTRVR